MPWGPVAAVHGQCFHHPSGGNAPSPHPQLFLPPGRCHSWTTTHTCCLTDPPSPTTANCLRCGPAVPGPLVPVDLSLFPWLPTWRGQSLISLPPRPTFIGRCRSPSPCHPAFGCRCLSRSTCRLASRGRCLSRFPFLRTLGQSACTPCAILPAGALGNPHANPIPVLRAYPQRSPNPHAPSGPPGSTGQAPHKREGRLFHVRSLHCRLLVYRGLRCQT